MEGAAAVPCLVCSPLEDLPPSTVIDLLMNSEGKTTCKVPPVHPKAGEVYLFAPENQQAKGCLLCIMCAMLYRHVNVILVPILLCMTELL